MAFKTELKKYQDLINKEINNFINDPVLKEFLLRGGKRLRPILLIKTYELISRKKEKRILLPSISVELLHASTLIHDDIMDEDEKRRNKPSMHKLFEKKAKSKEAVLFKNENVKFGCSAAIIKGNILYSLGAQCILNSSFPSKQIQQALKIYHEAYETVNQGQLKDLSYENKTISENDYINMVSQKTAKLMQASLEIGAVLGGASITQRTNLKSFGKDLAIAFQLKDDLIDIDKNSKKGNTFGSDIKKGKQTLLIIHAYNKANNSQKQILKNTLGNNKASKKDIEKVINILIETKSVFYVNEMIETLLEKCKTFAKNNHFLTELTNYIGIRTI